MEKDTNPVEEKVKEVLTEDQYKVYLERRKRSRAIFSTTEKAKKGRLKGLQEAVGPR